MHRLSEQLYAYARLVHQARRTAAMTGQDRWLAPAPYQTGRCSPAAAGAMRYAIANQRAGERQEKEG